MQNNQFSLMSDFSTAPVEPCVCVRSGARASAAAGKGEAAEREPRGAAERVRGARRSGRAAEHVECRAAQLLAPLSAGGRR